MNPALIGTVVNSEHNSKTHNGRGWRSVN